MCYNFHVDSLLEAEAYSPLSPVEFCGSSGWNDAWFYSGYQVLVKATGDRSCPSWRLKPLFSKLFNLFCCGSGVNVTWVPRNWAASFGICRSLSTEECCPCSWAFERCVVGWFCVLNKGFLP
uniref:Uncharacterized protein n=1 Tax=Cannabis sativa TaxID=3483 RepID=A0A803PWJ0_CANSA